MKIFISCRFHTSTKSLINLAKLIFKVYEIDAYVSGEVEPKPLPESIKKHIRGSDALFAIVTRKQNSWVQNEIGIAYGEGIPIYAIVEEGCKEGILEHITIYKPFNLDKQKSIIDAISEVAGKINESRTEEDNPKIYKFFKNKRERIIYNIGRHASAEQIFILLILNDINPYFFEIYKATHKREYERLKNELKLLE